MGHPLSKAADYDPQAAAIGSAYVSAFNAGCQTGGRLLADRALSRLLRGDWPRSLEEMEGLRRC